MQEPCASERDATPSRFERDTAVRRIENDGPNPESSDLAAGSTITTFEAVMDAGWWVVRGPNGGYLAAIIMRAMIEALDDAERAPRSLTIHFSAAPKEGPVRIEVRIERSGRSLSTLTARMTQGGALMALAIGAFSKPWGNLEIDHMRPPELPPPSQLERRAHGGIPIHDRWEHRFAPDSAPEATGSRAEIAGWIRAEDPSPIDAPLIAAYTDAMPPALFSLADPTEIGPLPTIDLTIHFRAPLPRRPSASSDDRPYCAAVFRSRLARDGFVEEDGEIWSPDGVLLAQSRQLAIVMK